MNVLCRYLNVQTGDLFSFFPFDIDVSSCEYDEENQSANISFFYDSERFSGELHCSANVEIYTPQYPEKGFSLNVELVPYEALNKQDEYENTLLRNAFTTLPIPSVDTLKDRICEKLIGDISHVTLHECDGEINGFPEDVFQWEYSVTLPDGWKKGEQ